MLEKKIIHICKCLYVHGICWEGYLNWVNAIDRPDRGQGGRELTSQVYLFELVNCVVWVVYCRQRAARLYNTWAHCSNSNLCKWNPWSCAVWPGQLFISVLLCIFTNVHAHIKKVEENILNYLFSSLDRTPILWNHLS